MLSAGSIHAHLHMNMLRVPSTSHLADALGVHILLFAVIRLNMHGHVWMSIVHGKIACILCSLSTNNFDACLDL